MEYLYTITKPDGSTLELYVYCTYDDHYFKGVTSNGTFFTGDTVDEVLAQWHELKVFVTMEIRGHSLVVRERPWGGYVGQWNNRFYHGSSLAQLMFPWRRDLDELFSSQN